MSTDKAFADLRQYAETRPEEERERILAGAWEREKAARRALSDQGSQWGPALIEMADSVLSDVEEAWEYADGDRATVEDRLHEIADNAVPIYTFDRARAMSEDISLACTEPEIETGRTVAEIAAAVLYDLAYQLAAAELERIAGESDES